MGDASYLANASILPFGNPGSFAYNAYQLPVYDGLKYLRTNIKYKHFRKEFDKIMELLLRINDFFLGATGIEMSITHFNFHFHGVVKKENICKAETIPA